MQNDQCDIPPSNIELTFFKEHNKPEMPQIWCYVLGVL